MLFWMQGEGAIVLGFRNIISFDESAAKLRIFKRPFFALFVRSFHTLISQERYGKGLIFNNLITNFPS